MVRTSLPADQREQLLAFALEWRGIETPCPACHGSGVRTYSSTATWHGGMGGASCTDDVCDKCWGSGDANRAWANLRRLRNEEEARIQKGAAEWLARRLGVSMEHQRAMVLRMADIIEKESRRRKVEFWWARACEGFAATLRDLAKP